MRLTKKVLRAAIIANLAVVAPLLWVVQGLGCEFERSVAAPPEAICLPHKLQALCLHSPLVNPNSNNNNPTPHTYRTRSPLNPASCRPVPPSSAL